MSNYITPPYPIFTDVNGTPLDAGFVFIGTEDSDAIADPINVYWDKEKTQLADQPLRTRNGYISKDGYPSKIFIDQPSCSIFVKNRFNTAVLKDLSFDILSNSSAVVAAVGAEQERATSVEAVLDQKIDVTNTTLDSKINTESTRAQAAEGSLLSQVNAVGVGNKAYKTYALMDADKASIPAKSKVTVTNDATVSNNGDWQWDGVVFTKSTYDPITQAKVHTDALTGGATPNLFIGTKFTLNFIDNTLTGGGGIVSYGTLYLDNIPQSQSIPLEAGEGYPFGLRKVCISKTTKAFKVFNSTEEVTSDYVLLGYLFGRKWHSISSGNKPTIIGNSDTYGGNVSDLKYSFDAEIVGGVLVLNKEAKTIYGNIEIYSPLYRGHIFDITLTYTGELAAIVVDTNGPVVKALKIGDTVSPSDLVIAKVSDEFIFSSSVLGAFSQAGGQRFKIYGKVSYSDITSEPAFLSEATRLTLNFSTGNLSVDQNGYIFHNGSFSSATNMANSTFIATNPTYVRYLVFKESSGKLELTETLTTTYNRNEILLGYVFDYKFYGFGGSEKCVRIINAQGQIVDNDQTEFDKQKQRALLPNKLFFLENRLLPIYKDSVFSNPKRGLEKVRTWIDTNNADIVKRYVPVTEQVLLNPVDLSSTFKFVYAHESMANNRYHKTIACEKAPQSNLSRSFNMLCFGDSLTQDSMPWTLKNKLESLGASVTSVGTFSSSETPHELPSEGRGWWNYRSFIGKDNQSGGVVHTRSPGGKTSTAKFENPFLKLATTQDKTDHPSWCFRFTGAIKELSYADDPVKTGDFYIFDFDWYKTQHSVANPDFITIALSTNDINLDREVYNAAEVMQFMQLGLEIMVKQIHKVLPSVPIGIVPCPAWSATVDGYTTFANETAKWVELCIKQVEVLRTTHSNIEVIPVYLHMNRDMGYPIVNDVPLSSDSDIQVGNIVDWVHFDQAGRDQYVEPVCAWLANSI